MLRCAPGGGLPLQPRLGVLAAHGGRVRLHQQYRQCDSPIPILWRGYFGPFSENLFLLQVIGSSPIASNPINVLTYYSIQTTHCWFGMETTCPSRSAQQAPELNAMRRPTILVVPVMEAQHANTFFVQTHSHLMQAGVHRGSHVHRQVALPHRLRDGLRSDASAAANWRCSSASAASAFGLANGGAGSNTSCRGSCSGGCGSSTGDDGGRDGGCAASREGVLPSGSAASTVDGSTAPSIVLPPVAPEREPSVEARGQAPLPQDAARQSLLAVGAAAAAPAAECQRAAAVVP